MGFAETGDRRISLASRLDWFQCRGPWDRLAVPSFTSVFESNPFDRVSAGGDPTAAYLAPFLAAVAVQMLTVAFVSTPEVWYPFAPGPRPLCWRGSGGDMRAWAAGRGRGCCLALRLASVCSRCGWVWPSSCRPAMRLDPRAVVAGWPTMGRRPVARGVGRWLRGHYATGRRDRLSRLS